jgi:spore coat protein U-like protein
MRKLLTLVLVAGLAPLAFADGNTSTATATASVTILAPVYVGFQGALNFGKVVVSAAPTTMAISNSAAVTTDSNADVFKGSAKIGTTVPVLSMSKDASATVAITYSSNLAYGTFMVDPALDGAIQTWAGGGTASYSGNFYGTLNFASMPPTGLDTGTIGVTANYN